ncbi:CRISPR-associated endonuclease Cas2 [Protofrankia symbiont of Coriaria ruscifolia]|uniref:CRISPR-associated endonuclease Cas2 n=1 Tax=Protofrankia symbiont of Coriaria ruscifolia TaxID=1306542 RepID=UPI0013EFA96B|nr:CRISPR-associated endonuclease Cas2 [Protofrankia symbiont of Coriaria ruscifolia]
MNAPRLGYVVTFDISCDAYRRRVGKVLEKYGPRILHSVYDIDVPSARMGRFTDRLIDMVEPRDHILVLPYCADCRFSWAGMPMDAPPVGGWVVTS